MSAAALACMLAAGWGGYLMRRQPAARPFRIFLSPPPGGSYDTRAGFALSPDGTRIALSVTDGAGKRMLWVRALDMPTAQLVLGTEGARYPFWSPDGRFIAFFAGGLLKKMDSGGGAVEQIAEAPNRLEAFGGRTIPFCSCPTVSGRYNGSRSVMDTRLRFLCWTQRAGTMDMGGLRSCPTAAIFCSWRSAINECRRCMQARSIRSAHNG